MGFDTSDDACVYKLREDLAIIQTVDFFPPVVDDPYVYGQIAAANALSDVYAMGGEPTLALNLLCFPDCLPPEVLQGIMEGGADKVREAGAIIAGGHSIEDSEPKYGLCVSGFIHPDAVWSNATAKPGDVLILTKPLGSGILNTAAKADLLTEEQMQPAIDTMRMLNKSARDVAQGFSIHACTDITGFGLLGHAGEMAQGSGVTLALRAGSIPLLPEAYDMAAMGIIPGGAYENRDYLEGIVKMDPDVALPLQDILYDPQTSGGLLFAAGADEADALLAKLEETCPQAAIIGQVVQRRERAIEVNP